MPSAGSNACYRKVVAGSAPPTTAIRFEAQATAAIDDHEAAVDAAMDFAEAEIEGFMRT